MEPSDATFQEIGRLCAGWAFLEIVTEHTVWGLLGADDRIGPIVTSKLDLRGRWALVLQHAPKKHNEADMKILRALNKKVETVARDRNIIVHGVVNAVGKLPAGSIGEYGGPIPHHNLAYVQVPCWTVFRGAEAGKCFPMSPAAVETVRLNIQDTARRVVDFNKLHRYTNGSLPSSDIQVDWPKRLE